MKAPIWRLEWLVALRRRRLFAMNVGIPLLLVAPLTFGGAPVFHAAAAYAVLFVLFGTFGSAIPLLRDGESGTLRTMILAGAGHRSLVIQRVLAGAVLDTIQLLPAMVLILWAGGASGRVWGLALPVLLGAVLAAGIVGVVVAALARSLAEGALFSAVVSLFLLHGSGVFRTPPPGSMGAIIESVLPFAPLHTVLLTGAGGSAGVSVALPAVLSAWAGTLVLLVLAVATGHSIIERISTIQS